MQLLDFQGGRSQKPQRQKHLKMLLHYWKIGYTFELVSTVLLFFHSSLFFKFLLNYFSLLLFFSEDIQLQYTVYCLCWPWGLLGVCKEYSLICKMQSLLFTVVGERGRGNRILYMQYTPSPTSYTMLRKCYGSDSAWPRVICNFCVTLWRCKVREVYYIRVVVVGVVGVQYWKYIFV